MSRDQRHPFPLEPGRMHELCGPGAMFFAISFAAQTSGPVLWAREHWQGDQLNPAGLVDVLSPDRLLMAATDTQIDTLAVAEESLRSGVVPLVVIELSKSLDLTAGRRLQLAARAGRALALAIIPQGAGSNAAETRWHCAPVCDPAHDPAYDPTDSTRHRWEIIKNKTGTLRVWDVRWSKSSRCIHVVPEVGSRTGSAPASG